MNGISSLAAAAQRPVGGIKNTLGVQQAEEKRREEKQPERGAAPVYDEYLPGEKPQPIGQYWQGKDEQGQPKIYFDPPAESDRAADPGPKPGPDKAADSPEAKPDANPAAKDSGKKADGKKSEKCVGSTDKVDREIEKLKRQKERLEQQLNAETDESKIKELQRKLNQVVNELRRKDNDTYRRSHMEVSRV